MPGAVSLSQLTLTSSPVSALSGTIWFAMKDPEGNPIEFVQERPALTGRSGEKPVSKVMIHAGFVVHDRADVPICQPEPLALL